jgi:hypothetical protein
MQRLSKQLGEMFAANPITAVALIAGAVALATTPIAFIFLGRMKWFSARRGRTNLRPDWWSVVIAMMLTMGVPAIFLALLVKSQYFDANRYEFDPNRTWSVVQQGRQYEGRDTLESIRNLDKAVNAEQKRLDTMRAELVDGVKKLDTAMLALRETARQNPGVIPQMNKVLDRMGTVRRSIGLDAPQQITDLTFDPAAMVAAGTPAQPAAVAPTRAAPVAAPASGLAKPQVDAILAAVPEPQKPLANMLPLLDLPGGFAVAKLPGTEPPVYIETFNADNLFEKIDGRAESFVQYGVKGMACCSYHPPGNEDDEVQLFVFEMGDPLKARGKYDSERPEEAKALASVGAGAYTAAGSVFFYSDRFYTIVNVARDDPKMAGFAKEIASKVVALQKRAKGSGPSPEDVFAFLPAEPKKSAMKYVAQDVFGYSFLSDVFLADYEVGDVKFQGFLRPYATADEAKKIFENYVATAKKDGAAIKEISGSKADKMVISDNIGLFDVVFLKGNTVGGSNGSTAVKPAEDFARSFAEALPANVPFVASGAKPAPDDAKEEKH